MTEEECERIKAAAKRAADALPPMSRETARRIAQIIAAGIRETEQGAAGSAA